MYGEAVSLLPSFYLMHNADYSDSLYQKKAQADHQVAVMDLGS
jgi:hypothetical protein